MKQQDLKEFKCSAQDTIANLENLTKNAAGYCFVYFTCNSWLNLYYSFADVPIKKPHLEFPERLNIHEQFEDRSVTVTTSDIIRYVCSLYFWVLYWFHYGWMPTQEYTQRCWTLAH